MKRITVLILLLLVICVFISTTASAVDSDTHIDWDNYSLEELLEIQKDLSKKIDELQSKLNENNSSNSADNPSFDKTSYPTANYSAIMREPRKYEGENLSIYGKVIQKQEGTNGVGPLSYTVMRVATKGNDDVFYVTCYPYIAEGIIEDDYITVYGQCQGTTTYTSIMRKSVTIPEIFAEKITLEQG